MTSEKLMRGMRFVPVSELAMSGTFGPALRVFVPIGRSAEAVELSARCGLRLRTERYSTAYMFEAEGDPATFLVELRKAPYSSCVERLKGDG